MLQGKVNMNLNKHTSKLLAGVFGLATVLAPGLMLAQNSSYPQTPVQNNTGQPPAQNNPPQNQNYPVYGNQNNQNYPTNGQVSGMQIPAGTEISILTDQNIDSKNAQVGQTFDAEIHQNVMGPNGNVIIPQGSQATLALVSTNPNNTTTNSNGDLALALQSVNINGQMYSLQSNTVNGTNNGGIGMNKRTGIYVGSGALIGTVVGAIAGGGKGAALGALLGGAAGAGTQVLTKGKEVKVPAETVLNFKLDQPVYLQ